MIFDGRNLHLTYAVFILTDFQQNLFIYNRRILHRQQKTSQWEVFLASYILLVSRRGFSLTKKQIEKQVFNLEFALLPIEYWAKEPAATEQNSFLTLKNALE